MAVLSIGLAILAALVNATASVLQRVADRKEPAQKALTVLMMWDLVHQPVWLAGITAMAVGFLLQATALGNGEISVVQPLLVLELPFTLLLGAAVFRVRPRLREGTAALGMTGGLILFLYSLSPSGGNPERTPPYLWALGVAAALGIVAAFTWLGRRSEHARRAVYLGIATGVAFGLTAALISGMTAAFAHGLLGVLTAWQTYLVIVIGPLSVFLLQNALQAGSLVASQPALTLSDPIVAVAWGVVIFSERVRVGAWLAGTLTGAALIAAGTILLSRSPLLHEQGGTGDDPPAGG